MELHFDPRNFKRPGVIALASLLMVLALASAVAFGLSDAVAHGRKLLTVQTIATTAILTIFNMAFWYVATVFVGGQVLSRLDRHLPRVTRRFDAVGIAVIATVTARFPLKDAAADGTPVAAPQVKYAPKRDVARIAAKASPDYLREGTSAKRRRRK